MLSHFSRSYHITVGLIDLISKDSLIFNFQTWEDITCLSISQSDDKDVDIEVMFAYGFHGDSGAFDGLGGTLAHGYYPGDNSIGLNGDIHFDESENWIGDDNLIKNEKRSNEGKT